MSEYQWVAGGAPSSRPFEEVKKPYFLRSSVGKRRGLWHFTIHNPIVLLASLLGIALIIACFGFTYWLSKLIFSCPNWSTKCEVKGSVGWITRHFGLIQGIVNTIYGIGLASMAYSGCAYAQTAFWPILRVQTQTLKRMDEYLSAARGSLPSLPRALLGIRSWITAVVLICVVFLTIIPLTGSIIVGWVYTKQDITNDYTSTYPFGGGLGLPVTQYNPPGPLPAALADAISAYTAWSRNISQEPMPEYRDFIMDRDQLSKVGNISVRAVKAQKFIECSGTALNLTGDVQGGVASGGRYIEVGTHVGASIEGNSDETIQLRMQPRLSVWIDSVEYKNSSRSISTMVFAVLNGTVESGVTTSPTTNMKKLNYTGISAVSCTVDVTLFDEYLSTDGMDPDESIATPLSNLTMLSWPNRGVDQSNADLATWLGTATTYFGASIFGTQPMYDCNTNNTIFESYTTTTNGNCHVPLSSLKEFISVSAGAVSMAMSRSWTKHNNIIVSRFSVAQIEQSRAKYLLVPMVVMFGWTVVLMAFNVYIHRRMDCENMKLAGTKEIVESVREGVILGVGGDGVEGMMLVKQGFNVDTEYRGSELGSH